MAKASFNGEVIAESNDTIVIENNQYFPPDAVKTEFLQQSGNTYECPWKGHADYYNVTVNGETATDGAFMYPQPKDAAKEIAGYYAFWNGVEVEV